MKQEEPSFDSFDFFSFLWKYRKPVIIVTVAGMILSVVVSLLIKPRFAAEVVLYPTASSSVSKTLISTQWTGNRDILSFGEEEETERLLQILQSDKIRNKLVAQFDLYNHYEIKPDAKYRKTLLNNKLKKNVRFRKTEYMAVKIRVMDTDPQIAANMANTIAALLDSTIAALQKEKARKAFILVRDEYKTLEKEVEQIKDSLLYLGELGIYDLSAQSMGISEAYAEAVRRNDQKAMKKMEKQMNVLGEHGAKYRTLSERLSYSVERLSNLRIKYSEAKIDAEQNLPNVYIINTAEVPDKKAAPKRSIIVMAGTLSAFLFAVILLMILDAFRRKLENT
jgi:uncharacterized protein involved in exopolysaccharide biosynthesis